MRADCQAISKFICRRIIVLNGRGGEDAEQLEKEHALGDRTDMFDVIRCFISAFPQAHTSIVYHKSN